MFIHLSFIIIRVIYPYTNILLCICMQNNANVLFWLTLAFSTLFINFQYPELILKYVMNVVLSL